MKVQVSIKTPSGKEATCTQVELLVDDGDTVASLKDRVALEQLIPFLEQDLILNGKVLEDGACFGDCCPKEGHLSMDLLIKASEETFVEQLRELLEARDLSCDELGLLYCFKHGANTGQALQCLGCADEKLLDFLRRQQCFQVESNHVALVRQSTTLKPFSVVEEMEDILKDSPTGCMEIKALCDKFTGKFNINLSSLISTKAIDFFAENKDRFVVTGRRFVALKSRQQPRETFGRAQQGAFACPNVGFISAPPGLDLPSGLSCTNIPTATFAPPPGLALPQGIECKNIWKATAPLAKVSATDAQQFLDLHGRICSGDFLSKSRHTMNKVIELVQGATFLNIERIVKGGSIAKGTAIDNGSVDGDITFFLPGLPPNTQDKWLPHLLQSVAGVLQDALSEVDLIESVNVVANSIRLGVQGGITINLNFSPVFSSYANAIAALSKCSLEARGQFAPSLSEERTQFIARQPTFVKVTIRLMKWWRDQQTWSSELTRPSDELLELIAVYSATRSKPQDQKAAVVECLSLLGRFDQLRIAFSNFYSRDDIAAGILRQRPLLLDPVNPCMNVADRKHFDSREMIAAAHSTSFF